MEYQIISSDNHFEVILEGELVFGFHDEFRKIIDAFKSSKAAECVLNAPNISHVDSAGLGMLLILKEEASKLSKPVVIMGARGQLLRMLELAKLDKVFDIRK